jgi:dipeptidyl aminopeptidase/acylaminoacyl peptidase
MRVFSGGALVAVLVTACGMWTEAPTAPMHLPGGRVAFSDRGRDLWWSAPDGSGRSLLTHDGISGGWVGGKLSPDGSMVAGERSLPAESGTSLFLVKTADGSSSRLSRKDTFVDGYGWSSDGRYIAYAELTSGGTLAVGGTLAGGVGDVHVYDVVTGTDRAIAPGNHPAFSPDGQRIAFDHPVGAIATVAVTGSAPTFLVNLADLSRLSATNAPKGMGLLGAPQWSADGRLIAYSAIERGELLEALQIVYVQEAIPGAPPRQWAIGKTGAIHHVAELRWSPASPILAYSFIYAQPHHHYIGTIDPTKPELRPLYDSAKHFLDFAWSPDGSVILLQVDDDDAWLYLRPADRSIQRQEPGGWKPDWCRCSGV